MRERERQYANSFWENQNKTDRVTLESETDNRNCHWRQNARFDKKENWSSPLLSSLSFHNGVSISWTLNELTRESEKEKKTVHCPSIMISIFAKTNKKNWKKWHMWIKQDGTYVRACVRVLMIIKFLATDPVVQHANITQLIVIKKEHRLIKNRIKPDVDDI